MNRIDLIRILYLLMAVTYEAVVAQSQGSPTQNIFQFLKATPATQKVNPIQSTPFFLTKSYLIW